MSPSQAEKAVDSLLDLDFDPFKPDATTPIGQTQSPMSQTLPWDLWTAPAAEVTQPAASDWAADFSGLGAGVEAAAPGGENGEAKAADGQGWPPADGWATEAVAAQGETARAETVGAETVGEDTIEAGTVGEATIEAGTVGEATIEAGTVGEATIEAGTVGEDTIEAGTVGEDTIEAGTAEPETPAAETVEPEAAEPAEAEVSTWDPEQSLDPQPGSDPFGLGGGEAEPGSGGGGEGDQLMPGIVFTDEHGQEMLDATEGSELGLYPAQGAASAVKLDWGLSGQPGSDREGSEYETADEWAESAGRNGGWAAAEEKQESAPNVGVVVEEAAEQPGLGGSAEGQGGFADWGVGDQADPFQTQADPFQTQADLFQTQTDPFQNEADPFQNETDPFQKQANEENETLFQTAEPAFPSTVAEAIGQSAADPFEGADVFASLQADPRQVDPFAQAGGAELVLDFVSDPFAEPPVGAGGGWASDPFASAQSWPENWAPVAGGDTWAFPGAADGQPNGFAQWGAFPDPAASAEGAVTVGDSPWQEVSGSCGFLSGSGQGDFTANWGDGGQDPAAGLPAGPGQGENQASGPAKGAPFETQGLPMDTIEAPGHRDTENSDLSEDEATNRRYGKLYQEVDTEKEEVSNNALNGVSQPEAAVAAVTAESSPSAVDVTSEAEAAVPEAETEAALEPVPETGEAQAPPDTAEAPATSPAEEKAADATVVEAESVASPEAESPEITSPSEAEKQPSEEAELETATAREGEVGSPTADAPAPTVDMESPKELTLTVEPAGGEEVTQEGAAEAETEEEKMPIPSVVIEPASSNEGDDDRDGDITSPTVSSGNGVTPESQPGPPGMPAGFLYKVEALHDFEAANSDELELKKTDVVLVIPTVNVEDQDAGWLTGMKERDWLQLGPTAPKGLFPENFTQRLE
ncbi:hypothetical protein COCON_G00136000 [Conger conger]|uniref:SH3 domain-containing protein n=1 Tax=Conger conger TaxID=82655 RepID=A0A9Q1DEY5_CONCO|nr:hypothetical protein COCON_G00136000 [Conger conger]